MSGKNQPYILFWPICVSAFQFHQHQRTPEYLYYQVENITRMKLWWNLDGISLSMKMVC